MSDAHTFADLTHTPRDPGRLVDSLLLALAPFGATMLFDIVNFAPRCAGLPLMAFGMTLMIGFGLGISTLQRQMVPVRHRPKFRAIVGSLALAGPLLVALRFASPPADRAYPWMAGWESACASSFCDRLPGVGPKRIFPMPARLLFQSPWPIGELNCERFAFCQSQSYVKEAREALDDLACEAGCSPTRGTCEQR